MALENINHKGKLQLNKEGFLKTSLQIRKRCPGSKSFKYSNRDRPINIIHQFKNFATYYNLPGQITMPPQVQLFFLPSFPQINI